MRMLFLPATALLAAAIAPLSAAPPAGPSPTRSDLSYSKTELQAMSKPQLVDLVGRLYGNFRWVLNRWEEQVVSVESHSVKKEVYDAVLQNVETLKGEKTALQNSINDYARAATAITTERDTAQTSLAREAAARAKLQSEFSVLKKRYLTFALIASLLVAALTVIATFQLVPVIGPLLGPYAGLAALSPFVAGALAFGASYAVLYPW